MILLIPVNESNGLDSKLSEHFGHCPFFASFDTETSALKFIKNELDHSDINLTPVDQIMIHKPNIIFTLGIGDRAKKLFLEKDVCVKTGEYKILSEVISNLDDLDIMVTSCSHNHE